MLLLIFTYQYMPLLVLDLLLQVLAVKLEILKVLPLAAQVF
jgi:hypothetical protein